jgi:hypothetical protein
MKRQIQHPIKSTTIGNLSSSCLAFFSRRPSMFWGNQFRTLSPGFREQRQLKHSRSKVFAINVDRQWRHRAERLAETNDTVDFYIGKTDAWEDDEASDQGLMKIGGVRITLNPSPMTAGAKLNKSFHWPSRCQ